MLNRFSNIAIIESSVGEIYKIYILKYLKI